MAILTIKQVAKQKKRTIQTIIKAIRSKRLPAQKIGRMWFIREEDLPLLIDKRYKQHKPQPTE